MLCSFLLSSNILCRSSACAVQKEFQICGMFSLQEHAPRTKHIAGEYKGARPGCPSKTKNLASNLDNNKNDSLTTRAVLRSKSYPTNHNQTHFHGRSKECRGKLEAENAPTRVCCICYEDVSLSDGVLCRKDEDKSLRMGLPVHFTCDACLEKHVQTQFPQETPVCAELARLGRGDGGLYCPCHPGQTNQCNSNTPF